MKSDLVVVVADGGIEQAVRGLLSRPEAIGIRPLRGVEYPKLHRMDGGTFSLGHELAAVYRESHSHALVMFDYEWEGRPTDDPQELVADMERRLCVRWGNAARCVVIVPELEVWLWSDSPYVAAALGWPDHATLRAWLEAAELWPPGAAKPASPKEAYLRAINEKRTERSNGTFFELAGKVSLKRCKDDSLQRLLGILGEWFPATTPPPQSH